MKKIEKCVMDAVYRRTKCSQDEPTLVVAAAMIRTLTILFVIGLQVSRESGNQIFF